MFIDRRSRKPSLLASLGALLAAAAVGLSAYAAHGVADVGAQAHLYMAALFAFGHGLALASLAPQTERLFGKAGLFLLLVGTVLFSGSLAGEVLQQWPTTLAPAGGTLLMIGWVVWALDALRR